jgi:hypothetical protein
MPNSNQKEVIDTRILRLIGLEDVFDLDYETYLTLLKEAMVKGRMAKTSIPTEEVELLTNEYKRVKTKKDKGRFEVKGKKITAGSFSVGQVKAKLSGTKSKGLLPAAIGKSPIASSLTESISAITSAVTSIAETLKAQKTLTDDATAFDKRKAEQDKRALAESKLEKRFDGLKKAAEKIIAPVKSLLDRVLEFFTTILLGRVVYKLIEWLGNPENANKVKSIIRFLGDWGPALLGGFILFGTKFGKGIRILTRIALSGIGKLAKAIPALLRFGKNNPKTALALATGAYAATQLSQRAFSGGDEKVQGLVGGGYVRPRFLGFSGGGFNFGNMFNGYVSGQKGVDKVPAMLTDGEFVMSRGAVEKYGVDILESMNAAGGGNNKPKVVSGTTYAAGGGMIGDVPQSFTQSSRTEARLTDLENKLRFDEKISPRYSKNLPKLGKVPKLGQSNVRAPIPASSAIVPYQSSALVKQPNPSALVSTPMQRINTNMNVPGGRPATRLRGGSLSAIMAAFEMKQRKDEGQTNVQAGLGAGASALGGQLGWMGGAKAGAIAGAALGSIIPGLGTAVGAGVGAILGGILGGYGGAMAGGKLADDFSGVNATKERVSRGAGGNIVGGYGLKEQSFKDAPKTSIITDDKGRPYVGYKALRNGKLTYIRNSAPGTGTTNPLEMLGRFINPGAYKDSDAKLGMQNQKIAMVNALESMQKQGMAADAQARMMKQMGGNLKDTQNDLNFRKNQAQIAPSKPKNTRGVKPPTSAKPRVMYGPPAPQRKNKRGGGTTTSTPSFNATTRGSSAKQQTLGLVG